MARSAGRRNLRRERTGGPATNHFEPFPCRRGARVVENGFGRSAEGAGLPRTLVPETFSSPRGSKWKSVDRLDLCRGSAPDVRGVSAGASSPTPASGGLPRLNCRPQRQGDRKGPCQPSGMFPLISPCCASRWDRVPSRAGTSSVRIREPRHDIDARVRRDRS